jgi:hypothetical protein
VPWQLGVIIAFFFFFVGVVGVFFLFVVVVVGRRHLDRRAATRVAFHTEVGHVGAPRLALAVAELVVVVVVIVVVVVVVFAPRLARVALPELVVLFIIVVRRCCCCRCRLLDRRTAGPRF